ncbi:MAG: hypothetical protein V4773_01270 [Verrucomicrobiota bacterium]
MTADEYDRFVMWCLRAPLSELLSVSEDEHLCSAVHSGLWRDAPDVWRDTVGEVKLIAGAIGTIGNGGFDAISEDGIPADPDFSRTIAALRAIGADSAAQVFSTALARISTEEAPDLQTHLDALSTSWFEEKGTVYRLLARHIRSNADRILTLAGTV